MIKCPICQFDNEDGALFCDHCKSDLATTEPVAAVQRPAWEAAPLQSLDHTPPVETAIPVAAVAIAEVHPVEAAAIPSAATPPMAIAEAVAISEDIPIASAVEAAPPIVETGPVEVKAGDQIAATAAAVVSPVEPVQLAKSTRPRLVVTRGQRINAEYSLYEGDNYIGRADEQAVDIDLEDQEDRERIWSSRQHAVIVLKDGQLTIEDLNSTNGTFVNRMRLHPGQKRPLQANDVIQIGTVQMKVTM